MTLREKIAVWVCFAFGVMVFLGVLFAASTVHAQMYKLMATDVDAATGSLYATDATYNTARAKTTDQVGSSVLRVGQRWSGSAYYVHRGALTFDTSTLSNNASLGVSYLKIVLDTENDMATADSLYLVTGTFSGATMDAAWFNDFGGWAAGNGAYTLTKCAPAQKTFGKSTGDTLTFTLNAAGIANINKTGYTTFMLVCETDRSNTTPAAPLTALFEDASPYMEINYGGTFGITRTVPYDKAPNFVWVNGNSVPIWKP